MSAAVHPMPLDEEVGVEGNGGSSSPVHDGLPRINAHRGRGSTPEFLDGVGGVGSVGGGVPVDQPSQPQPPKDPVRRRKVLHRSGYSYEQLTGDDFLNTPWVPPDPRMALRKRAEAMAFGGTAKIWGTPPSKFIELGIGTTLHFLVLKYITFMFVAMTIALLPALYLNAIGSRTKDPDVSLVSFYGFMLSNLGSFVPVTCDHDYAPSTCNSTNPIKASLVSQTMSEERGYLVVSLSDTLASFVFIFFIWYMHDRVSHVAKVLEGKDLSAANYTVFARGLPPSATEEDVLKHFHGLYDLSQEDWTFRGFCCFFGRKTSTRRPVESTLLDADDAGRKHRYSVKDSLSDGPVLNATNSGNPMYLRTYVAEVVLCHPNGGLLRNYRKQEKLLRKIRVMRALAKRYNVMSPYEDEDKFNATMKTVKKLEARMKSFDKRYATWYSEKVVGAFVTFNCAESYARCLEDYHDSFSYLGLKFQAPPLRMQGAFPLSVSAAPEPGDLLWENVEVTPVRRRKRIWLVYLVLVLVLFLSGAVTFVVSTAAEKLTDELPKAVVCLRDVPATLYDSYEYPSDIALYRGTAAQQETCAKGTFYLDFGSVSEGPAAAWIPSDPDAAYNITGGTSPCANRCFKLGQTELCHPPAEPNSGFEKGIVAECFCVQTLREKGFIGGLRAMLGDHSDLCSDLATRSYVKSGFGFLASLVLLVTNQVLDSVLWSLTRFERHMSMSEENSSLMFKNFASQFINTALILLLVYMKLPNWLSSQLTILDDRQVDGFDLDWYFFVAPAITTTMTLQAVAPFVVPLFDVISHRFRRKRALEKSVCQEQMDTAAMPPAFNIVSRASSILTTSFVTLLYSSPLPLLIPVAAFTMTLMYWGDKALLLRSFAKPPRLSTSLVSRLINTLPYALLLHLVVGVFTFGNPEVTTEKWLSLWNEEYTDMYHRGLTKFTDTGYDYMDMVPYLRQEDVAPFFGLLAGIVLYLLLIKIAGSALLKALKFLLWLFSCGLLMGKSEKFSFPRPMFTAPYIVKRHRGKAAPALGEDKAREGWQLIPDPTGAPGAMAETKVWTSDGKCNGVRHRRGQRKLTWQVIRDVALPTYDLLANPQYNVAMSAIQDVLDKELVLPPSRDFFGHNPAAVSRHESALASLSPSGLPFVPAHMFADWAALTEEEPEEKPSERPKSAFAGLPSAIQVTRVPANAVQVNVHPSFLQQHHNRSVHGQWLGNRRASGGFGSSEELSDGERSHVWSPSADLEIPRVVDVDTLLPDEEAAGSSKASGMQRHSTSRESVNNATHHLPASRSQESAGGSRASDTNHHDVPNEPDAGAGVGHPLSILGKDTPAAGNLPRNAASGMQVTAGRRRSLDVEAGSPGPDVYGFERRNGPVASRCASASAMPMNTGGMASLGSPAAWANRRSSGPAETRIRGHLARPQTSAGPLGQRKHSVDSAVRPFTAAGDGSRQPKSITIFTI